MSTRLRRIGFLILLMVALVVGPVGRLPEARAIDAYCNSQSRVAWVYRTFPAGISVGVIQTGSNLYGLGQWVNLFVGHNELDTWSSTVIQNGSLYYWYVEYYNVGSGSKSGQQLVNWCT